MVEEREREYMREGGRGVVEEREREYMREGRGVVEEKNKTYTESNTLIID